MTLITDDLFREDAALLHCDARISELTSEGVILDRTVFYPQGGGQAGDLGTLTLPDGRELTVMDTRKHKRDDGQFSGGILHVVAAENLPLLAGLPRGMPVMARIDAARRHAHMRFHTATHLLCALVPHPVDGCAITATHARLDFHTDEPFDKEALNAGLARLVNEAHAVRLRWITDEELDAQPQLVRSMSVQPPRGSGRVRLVDIEGVDLQPCGGTHVNNTAEVGSVQVTKIEKKSATTRRVVLGLVSP
jgi:misacylated tRNA(Ala) deacylase